MQGLAQQLSARRFSAGALRIDNIKLAFRLDANGLPEDCRVSERKEANKLIEEVRNSNSFTARFADS